MPNLLSLFDYSGNWSQPYREAGWNVVQVDIKIPAWVPCDDCEEYWCNWHNCHASECDCPPIDEWESDPYCGSDIMEFPYKRFEKFNGILIAVPCTDFSLSGAQYWKAKDQDGRTNKSASLVRKSLEIVEYFNPDFWALENPAGRINKVIPELGNPAYWFHPSDYGADYTKKSYLWGRFIPPMALFGEGMGKPVPVDENFIMKLGGKSERTKELRSITPPGFARAFYLANSSAPNKAWSGRVKQLVKL